MTLPLNNCLGNREMQCATSVVYSVNHWKGGRIINGSRDSSKALYVGTLKNTFREKKLPGTVCDDLINVL